jgi:hypothetical protein
VCARLVYYSPLKVIALRRASTIRVLKRTSLRVRDVIDEDSVAMVEIEEEENLSELSVTQLKKRMKERGIEASGCTEVTGTPTLARTPCLTAATPRAPTP